MNRSFYNLVVGQSLANFSDVFLTVGVMTFIYGVTGKATLMAVVPLVNMGFRSLSALVAPLMMNRYAPKSLLVLSQMVKTLALIFVIFVLSEPAAFAGWKVIYFYTLFGVISFFDGWATPSRNALIPRIVEKDQLGKANGLLASVDQFLSMGAWAGAGVILATFGMKITLGIIFISYFISTVSMIFIDSKEGAKVNEEEKHSIVEGWRYIWKNKVIRYLTLGDMFLYLSSGVWAAAILFVFTVEILHVTEEWWGFINASYMVGLIVAGMLFYRYDQFFLRSRSRVFRVGAVMLCLCTFGFGLGISPLVGLLIAGVFGIFDQLYMSTYQVFLQETVGKELLPKVYAAFEVLTTLFFGVSTALMAFLVDVIGAQAVFYIAGTILSITVFFSFRATKVMEQGEVGAYSQAYDSY